MQFKVTPKLRELTDLVWVKSLTRQGQQLDLHSLSSHFTQFWRKYLRTFIARTKISQARHKLCLVAEE